MGWSKKVYNDTFKGSILIVENEIKREGGEFKKEHLTI